jgi:hypothetical protein
MLSLIFFLVLSAIAIVLFFSCIDPLPAQRNVTLAGLMADAKAQARRTDPVCPECGLQPTIDWPPCLSWEAERDRIQYPKCCLDEKP